MTYTRGEIINNQLKRLNNLLSFLSKHNKFYQQKIAGVTLPLTSLTELTRFPFTTKKELVQDQQDNPPYGNNHSYSDNEYVRYHQTSGTTGKPLKVLDTQQSWDWWAECWIEVLKSAGVTKKDRVFLAFSFGPFIGFWAAYEGAKKLGAMVIPGGGQTSLERLQSMINNRATVLVCTPSYALHLDEVARENGINLRDTLIRATIHAGEPGASIPVVRNRIEDIWGARCYDHSGMTEMGAYGYSCSCQTGIHVNEAEFIAEVINPETLQPVNVGEQGELVLTNLGRFGYPVIRYRTHDLVLYSDQQCDCGNPHLLLPSGILGRSDDMVIVRGINIFPPSIEAIIREFPQVQEFRIVLSTVGGMDQIKVEVELDDSMDIESRELLIGTMAVRLRERVGLRIDVELKGTHELPRFEMKARRTLDMRSRLGSSAGGQAVG